VVQIVLNPKEANMAWEAVGAGTAVDIKKSPGEAFEGTYIGHDEIQTKIGQQTIWKFEKDDGSITGIYGFTNLNRVMESMAIGATLQITYKGTENVKTKYGQKDVHQVDVRKWKEDGIGQTEVVKDI
jgi:hypothetical protein